MLVRMWRGRRLDTTNYLIGKTHMRMALESWRVRLFKLAAKERMSIMPQGHGESGHLD